MRDGTSISRRHQEDKVGQARCRVDPCSVRAGVSRRRASHSGCSAFGQDSVENVNPLWSPTVYWAVMGVPEVMQDESADTRTFEGFFMSSFAKVRAAAARIIGPSLAEDLAVEAFARAFARWGRVSKLESPEAWVVRVATNAALDEVRRKKAFLPVIVARDAPADIVEREDVVSAIRSLTRRQQEVVVLRYIVDLSEAEVGRVLHMSTGSVKTHLHRAILRLRDQLSKEDLP
jgi:RNA polymerase sigma factor (sigma-70 family)